MNDTVRVFVNERGVDAPAGSTVSDAVAALDPALAEQVASGKAAVTDGRGIAVAPGALVHAGAIFRVVVSARASAGAHDAHP